MREGCVHCIQLVVIEGMHPLPLPQALILKKEILPVISAQAKYGLEPIASALETLFL
jgi:hypothetical protein